MQFHGDRPFAGVEVHGEDRWSSLVLRLGHRDLFRRLFPRFFRRRTAEQHCTSNQPPRPNHRPKYAMLDSVPPMAVYDDFAWFYDRYWNEEFHSAAFPILERIFLPRLDSRARVIDVCCGTGYLARLLTDRGYRVTGVDASPSMVELAQMRAPAAHFTIAEAATFRSR